MGRRLRLALRSQQRPSRRKSASAVPFSQIWPYAAIWPKPSATTSAARFAASDSQNESWTYWVRPPAGSSRTLRITAALAHPRLAERIYPKLPLFMPVQVELAGFLSAHRPLACFGAVPAFGMVGPVIGNTARTCSAHIWQKAVA